jgi:hypothetical protein
MYVYNTMNTKCEQCGSENDNNNEYAYCNSCIEEMAEQVKFDEYMEKKQNIEELDEMFQDGYLMEKEV